MALLSNPIVRRYRFFVRHATRCNRKYRSLDSLTERQVQAGRQSERGYDLPRTLPVFWLRSASLFRLLSVIGILPFAILCCALVFPFC